MVQGHKRSTVDATAVGSIPTQDGEGSVIQYIKLEFGEK